MIALFRKQPASFYRSLRMLSMPIILQNLITTALGFTDTFMVGLLGNEQMSAVTLANVPIFILQMLIFGLQSGSAVLISQYWGRQDLKNINRVMGVGFMVAGGLASALAVILFFFSPQVMMLVTNNPALQELGAPYLKLVGLSYVFNSLSSIYVGAHRSVEHPQLGATVFGVSMLLNTVLNYILIFGKFGAPAMGIIGAAIATLASRIVEFLICLIYALRCKELPLDFSALLRPGTDTLRSFIRYSAPVVCNETLWGTGSSMFNVIMGHMVNSTDMVAAYTLVGYVEKLFTVVVFGLAAAAAVVVGKAIGAGEDDHAVREKGDILLVISALCGLAVGLFMLLLLPLLLQPVVFPLFKLSVSGTQIATVMLVFAALRSPLKAYNCTLNVGVLRGGGDVATAMLIDISPLWCVAVPVMALAALVLQLDIVWVCLAYMLEDLVKFPLGVLRLRSKKWIKRIASPQ